MLNSFNEEQFAALRGPLESGRQTPSSLAGILVLTIFLQAILVGLAYFVGHYSLFPYKEQILFFHLVFSSIIAVMCILYAFPTIYIRSQKIQYLLSIIVSQNLFGFSFFLLSILTLGAKVPSASNLEQLLLNFSFLLLLVGILLFITTCIRFYFLIRNGKYRKGSSKDKLRSKFEKKSLLPPAIVVGTGIVFLLQYLFRTVGLADFQVGFFIILSLVIYLVMLFVLPEQLVILYCKYRFKSFNFRRDGRLYDFGEEDRSTNKGNSNGRIS